jgi:hypothetical protein
MNLEWEFKIQNLKFKILPRCDTESDALSTWLVLIRFMIVFIAKITSILNFEF